MVTAVCYRQQGPTPACDLLLQEGFEFSEQRIVAIQHVVERGARNRLRPMVTQETAERVQLRRRAVQRDHPRRGRAAEWRDHAKPGVRLGEKRSVTAGKAGADLAVFAGTRTSGDVVENNPRGLAGLTGPVGTARGDKIG